MTRSPVSPVVSSDRRALGIPAVVALALALLYLVDTPRVGDLAAQTARADLFSRSGDVAWWAGWYGGLGTSSYSLTTPALLGILGPVLLGAASLVITPLAALPLLRRSLRPVAGGVALALTAAADVAAGRITFAVGLVVGLLALSAAVEGRVTWAATLATAAVLTSPVAGLLVVLVAAALAIERRHHHPWLALVAGGLVGVAFLFWLAGGVSTGVQPFDGVDLALALGGTALVLLAPVGRSLRAVAAVGAVALVTAYLVPTAVGSNLVRLVLLGVPPAVIANARLGQRRLLAVGALACVLPVANLAGSLVDASGPGGSEQFVTALRTQLAAEPLLRDHRLEVVDVASHWPSARLLPTVTLARGWERQVDEYLNPELYQGSPLTAAAYRAFLDRNAVAFVAVPRSVPLDFGTKREAALVAHGLAYLKQVWSNADWLLYAVARPVSVIGAPASAVQLTDTGAGFTAPVAGSYPALLRWSPYLVVDGGSVSRAPDGNLVVAVPNAGRYLLHAVWRLP